MLQEVYYEQVRLCQSNSISIELLYLVIYLFIYEEIYLAL